MKVLMLIKTTGLEYDDRLRKEVLSLQDLGLHVKIAALEYANCAERKVVYGGISASSIRLHSRSWFKRTKGLAIKALEMYCQFFLHVIKEKPDVVWFHNLELRGLVPLLALMRKIGYIDELIWDQHELPSDTALASSYYMAMLSRLMNYCDKVIVANEERLELIKQLLNGELQTPVHVLHNYPDYLFRNLPRVSLPESIRSWLGGAPYLLAQGGANPERYLKELVEAVLQDAELKLIVVGPYRESQLNELNQRHGSCWHDQIYFTGFVPQLEIPSYIDHAVASVVFYATNVRNNNLCAPNRLYQALVRGVPVIAGPNPPMARLIKTHGCGVIVDHTDPASISQGIKTIRTNRQRYQARVNACKDQFDWNEQQETLAKLLSSNSGIAG